MATNNSNFDILIKRRLKGGSSSAPSDNTLKNGELAMNEESNTLYYGMSTGSNVISSVPIAGEGYIKSFLSSGEGAGNLTLGTSITSDITVGSIDEGETLDQNTTLFQFVTALLYKEYNPTVSAPSATISKTSPVGDVEYGSLLSVDLNASLSRGSIFGKMENGEWKEGTVQGNRAGTATKYEFQVDSEGWVDNFAVNEYTYTSQAFTATKTYKARVTHGQGDEVYTSKNNVATKDANGNNLSQLAVGTVTSSTITITPKAAVFTKTSSTDIDAGTSAELKALTKTLAKAIDSTADYSFNLSFSVGHKYAVIAYPKDWGTLKSVKLSNGQDITDAFVQQTDVALELSSGGNEDYYVYKWTGDTAMSNANTWVVTLP